MKTRAETRFPAEIVELYTKDPIVHRCMDAYEVGHFTYRQALEQMVIALAETNGKLSEVLLESVAMTQPQPIVISQDAEKQ